MRLIAKGRIVVTKRVDRFFLTIIKKRQRKNSEQALVYSPFVISAKGDFLWKKKRELLL